jgi:hypothetical protein
MYCWACCGSEDTTLPNSRRENVNSVCPRNYWDDVNDVRFEVFIAVTMKNAVFCYVTPCGSPEDAIIHSHCRENLKSYIVFHYGEATHGS